MRSRNYVLAFVVLALVDALTTWFGVRAGFQEANPLVAERLSSPLAFFGSYALFTALGVGVVEVSIRLEKLNPVFKLIALGMVVLKGIPAVNNLLLLTGLGPSGVVATTPKFLLTLALSGWP
ncbi:hypothetical protein TEU_10415 [Thermococcus eurythermalis]|uniref:DUF5658 domain-containing protein n=1 Tax=Thermococcus eurythermalis TaxID=1505907 RepID=A0A097QW67_9EURY|nr:DUF5658 family protein [Thermococcus eurythermalis]AIU70715.1 hypothetical protein TEU_10415 [Thermococcus eurythermalis]